MARTAEELEAIIKRVRDATEFLRQDAHLHAIAFEKLLEHELAAPALNGLSAGGAPPARSSDPTEPIGGTHHGQEARAETVGRYFGISPDEAEDLFDLHGESPSLALPPNKLEPAKAKAVRQIALLICGARTALGLETGSVHIRDAAGAYGKADANFMAHLTGCDAVAVRGKPNSQNRLVRMRVTGAETAQELAQKLVANGG